MVGFDVGGHRRGLRKKSWYQNGKFCHFWAILRSGTGTRTGVVLIPPYRGQMVLVPRQSGTGSPHQNRFGTSTDLSGIGTTASCNLDFWYSCIIKLKFVHRGYRNPNK